MRQHIINGMNGSSIMSNGSMQTIVLRHDADALCRRTGKPLSPTKYGTVSGISVSGPVVSTASFRTTRNKPGWAGQESPPAVWQAASVRPVNWSEAAVEPPAAAWASLVISRAISA